MALPLRLRRALTLSSIILKDCHFLSITSRPPSLPSPNIHSPLRKPSPRPPYMIPSQSFRSSAVLSIRRNDGFDESKIDPDEILFEGCDYNHWLITIDFPREPENKPTPEQMVETYVQTAAQVFGSVEEAKKRIYACSTSTYHGFQVVCDEATSEKFRGLPGVVFILPDSYIDPVNKEYGGDKYENGVITPRPPPVQYGRQGRYGDRNRNYDRQPRYDRPRDSMPPQQDGRGYGPPQQDGRGYAPQQQDGRGYDRPTPQQDGRGYGPPQQDGRGYSPQQQDGRGYAPQQQDGRGYAPPQQDGRSYVPQQQDRRGYAPPQQDGRGYVPPQQEVRGYAPPQQDGRGYIAGQQDGRGYIPPQNDGRGYGQGERRDYAPAGGQGYPAGGRGGYQGERRDQMPPYRSGPQGQQGNPPPQQPGNFSQGSGGDFRPVSGEFRQPPPGYGGNFGQGSAPGYTEDSDRVQRQATTSDSS